MCLGVMLELGKGDQSKSTFVPEAPGGFIKHYENSLQALYGTVRFIIVSLSRKNIQNKNRTLEIDTVSFN